MLPGIIVVREPTDTSDRNRQLRNVDLAVRVAPQWSSTQYNDRGSHNGPQSLRALVIVLLGQQLRSKLSLVTSDRPIP